MSGGGRWLVHGAELQLRPYGHSSEPAPSLADRLTDDVVRLLVVSPCRPARGVLAEAGAHEYSAALMWVQSICAEP